MRADLDRLAFLLDPAGLLGHAGDGRHHERVAELVLAGAERVGPPEEAGAAGARDVAERLAREHLGALDVDAGPDHPPHVLGRMRGRRVALGDDELRRVAGVGRLRPRGRRRWCRGGRLAGRCRRSRGRRRRCRCRAEAGGGTAGEGGACRAEAGGGTAGEGGATACGFVTAGRSAGRTGGAAGAFAIGGGTGAAGGGAAGLASGGGAGGGGGGVAGFASGGGAGGAAGGGTAGLASGGGAVGAGGAAAGGAGAGGRAAAGAVSTTTSSTMARPRRTRSPGCRTRFFTASVPTQTPPALSRSTMRRPSGVRSRRACRRETSFSPTMMSHVSDRPSVARSALITKVWPTGTLALPSTTRSASRPGRGGGSGGRPAERAVGPTGASDGTSPGPDRTSNTVAPMRNCWPGAIWRSEMRSAPIQTPLPDPRSRTRTPSRAGSSWACWRETLRSSSHSPAVRSRPTVTAASRRISSPGFRDSEATTRRTKARTEEAGIGIAYW